MLLPKRLGELLDILERHGVSLSVCIVPRIVNADDLDLHRIFVSVWVVVKHGAEQRGAAVTPVGPARVPLPPQVFLRRRLLPSQQSSLQHTGADPERRESHRSRRLPLRALEVHVERVPYAHDAGVRVGQLGSGLSRRDAELSLRSVPLETSDADRPFRLHAPRVHEPEQREVQLVAVVDAHGAGVHAARVDDGHHPPHALRSGSDCVT